MSVMSEGSGLVYVWHSFIAPAVLLVYRSSDHIEKLESLYRFI